MNKRFVVPGVDARTPLGEAAGALLLAKAEPLFELEAAACGGADMDAVHDMRVASRRLREAMRLLEPLYPPKAYRAWYRRIRRITRALGPVRDSDVFIDAFSNLGKESDLGDGGRRAVAFMVGARMGQRIHELAVLNQELGRLDLDASRASFAEFAGSLDASAGAGDPFSDFAHAAVSERAAIVAGAQPIALDEANVAEQHALRIDYKRLRYAVEAFAPCYLDAFDGLHATLTAFQDALGDLHDLHIFLDMLAEPQRVKDAARAGVSTVDIAQVSSVLQAQANAEFARFTALARQHPAEKLARNLLAPLEGQEVVGDGPIPIEAYVLDAPDDAAAAEAGLSFNHEAPVLAPVIVGDTPWEDGWDDDIPALPMEVRPEGTSGS